MLLVLTSAGSSSCTGCCVDVLIICPHPRIPCANYKKGAARAQVYIGLPAPALFFSLFSKAAREEKREKRIFSLSLPRTQRKRRRHLLITHGSNVAALRRGTILPARSLARLLLANKRDSGWERGRNAHSRLMCEIAAPRARPGAICHSAVNTENRCLHTKAQISARLQITPFAPNSTKFSLSRRQPHEFPLQ